MKTVYTIKSTEDLKSEYKAGSDHYQGQTQSRLEAKKRNRYARFRFLIAKISLLSL